MCTRYKNIMWKSLSVPFFGSPHQKTWPPQYSWHITESGANLHNPTNHVVVSIQKETALIKTLQNYDVAQKLNCLKEKNQTKTRKKKYAPPHLIIMVKVVLLGVIFFKNEVCL